MDKLARIYVAGHKGLVGSAIVRKLTSLGFTNLVVKDQSGLDLRKRADVDSFFERERPEYVFLAAAKVGGILANSTYKAEFIHDNLAIALNVIDASYRAGVRKLLNLGSSCIYPRLAPQPLKEESLLTGELESTNEPYAIAKIAAIKLCRYYNEQYGTNYISVMPTNLYGPGDNFSLETSHVLPALVRKFHLAKLLHSKRLKDIRSDMNAHPFGYGFNPGPSTRDEGIVQILNTYGIHEGSVALWGTGGALREFLHSDDLADAVVHLMQHREAKEIGEFVNIGSGTDITIRLLAEKIRSLVGYEGEIVFDSTKPDGTHRKLLDLSRIKSLGWSPTIGLDEGLKSFYAWYRSSVPS
ncbi:MAG TPA: GDP-L-fucose synthase [Bacteroidota bacterium]|nr:GDP-L-fucose synthase [Bacteroidota bacterium]